MIRKEKGMSQTQTAVIVFAIAIAVAVGGLFLYKRMGEGPSEEVEYKTYAHEDYDFSLSYPSTWTLENMEMPNQLVVLVRENVTEGGIAAQIRVTVGQLGISSLDNLSERIEKGIENDENATMLEGPQDIELQGVPGIDFTLKVDSPEGRFRMRQIVFDRDNRDYNIFSVVQENSYDEFKSDIDYVFKNFSFS